jgi:hypothetical protein
VRFPDSTSAVSHRIRHMSSPWSDACSKILSFFENESSNNHTLREHRNELLLRFHRNTISEELVQQLYNLRVNSFLENGSDKGLDRIRYREYLELISTRVENELRYNDNQPIICFDEIQVLQNLHLTRH